MYGGGPSHGLAPHSNRACWSNSPATSGPITVWFESNPAGSSGNDILLGENRAGGTVGLGRGLRGTAEACWAHAVWIGANRDIEFWDGGDTVTTVFSAGDAYGVGCVGPWVTVATADGIYASNMLTGSAVDACSTVEYADEGEAADLERTLLDWVHTNYTEVPSDVTTSVSAIGLDGWWIGGGSFSDYLEAAIFVWYPSGNIGVAWAGSADSVNDIRQYMFSVLPEAPTALLGCVNVSGFAEP